MWTRPGNASPRGYPQRSPGLSPMLVEGMRPKMTTMSGRAHPDLDRRRLMLGLCGAGLACSGLLAVLFGDRTAPAAGQERAAGATVVTVTAGKPSEYAFTLSKSSALRWQAKAPSDS